ncbi:MAG: HesA/MoeB/ThiF family protein [Clostridia bacterium]|nr:HesA/MoeB/ThiF family protein [Clostridia bacterium]
MNSEGLDSDKILRYSRQLILKEIGPEGQEKLLNAKVLVAGAGGLGSPVLFYLAAAGVGTIGIADFDTVTLSNLNRQILHFTGDLGRRKVDSAAEKIKLLNPEVKVVKHPVRLSTDNVEDVVQDYDVVIDALDNFPARYLLSDCCFFMKKPLVEGAAVGFDGILMTILPGNSPCYRCLYPEPPKDGVVPACGDTGILGAVTGTIGSLQALEAIKVILGIGKTLTGRILTFDALELNIREVQWKRRENCPLCGKNPTIRELEQYELKCKLKTVE